MSILPLPTNDKVMEAESLTEKKIIEAATQVFLRKGYAAATTREIAEEAGINSALLNYYFRSKERLFDIVTKEQVAIFFGNIYPIVNDETSTLEEKVKGLVSYYTKILLAEPRLMLFISSEMQNRPERISVLMNANRGLAKSLMAKQISELRPDIEPMQVFMSILGMIAFPFLGRDVFQQSMGISSDAFQKILKDRLELLPVLIKAMLLP